MAAPLTEEIEMKLEPSPGEIAEAARHPGGYIYRIAASVGDPNGRVPPEAILGAWKVDAAGKIIGGFVPNPKYDAAKGPAKTGACGGADPAACR
jgi:hypothetical protein